MTLAIWHSRFETGITSIDRQHQDLFEAINRAAASAKTAPSPQVTQASLDYLLNYTFKHFQLEESFMREHGYPGLISHMAEHAQLALLIQKAQALHSKLTDPGAITGDVAVLIWDWLQEHIVVMDMGYVAFLKTKGPVDHR